MRRSDERILTTHVGSLIRSPEVVEYQIRHSLGEPVDVRDFEDAIRRGVEECVREQLRAGIDVIDDGEFGKRNWIAYLCDRLDGMVGTDATVDFDKEAATWPEQERYADFYRAYVRHESIDWLPNVPSRERYRGSGANEYTSVACKSELAYRPASVERDIRNLKAALANQGYVEAFMPVVAPGSIELVRNHHYPSQEDYLYALARELNKEYRLIVDAGFLLQVDDAILPMMHAWRFSRKPKAEYFAWAEVRIDVLNKALEGIAPDRVRYHMCFGSHNMPHTWDLGLREMLDLILKVHADAYSFEAAGPRHEHEWTVWRDVKLPPEKVLMPGLISHATNIVEHPELVAQRIEQFAGCVGRERVIASTDCGFSQGWNSPRVHFQVQWAKLDALSAGARLASQELWGRDRG